MRGITIAFTSLLFAYAHSKANTASIPCNSVKAKTSNRKLSYEWTYAEPTSFLKNQSLDKRMKILSDGTLLINHFTKQDYGEYKCQVKDGNTIIEEVPVYVNEQYTEKSATEYCSNWQCISANKCQTPDTTRTCPDGNDVCCPTMREEDKHRCQHFLGECMENCHRNIQATRADDCPAGSVCCVLV